jgi:hypothetical protein
MSVSQILPVRHRRAIAGTTGTGCDTRWPAKALDWSNSSIVKIARSSHEVEEIGRLRYQSFVIDQGQLYQASSDENPMLIDPIDPLSVNLYVKEAAKISMALRMSWSSDVTPLDYLALLTSRLPEPLRAGPTIVCSRLISSYYAPDVKKLVILFRRAFEIGVRSGCTHSVLSTHQHRIPLFERFGYRNLGIAVDDPVAGTQHVLVLNLRDVAYMEKVSSPLEAVARRLLS